MNVQSNASAKKFVYQVSLSTMFKVAELALHTHVIIIYRVGLTTSRKVKL
jgi:hypothetical protein